MNDNKNDFFELNLKTLFKEYGSKNLALILINDTNSKKEKYLLDLLF